MAPVTFDFTATGVAKGPPLPAALLKESQNKNSFLPTVAK
jgi:hypothetical protein